MDLAQFLQQASDALQQWQSTQPPRPAPTDWQATAFRWRARGDLRWLQAVAHPHHVNVEDLHNVGRQRDALVANTRQFALGRSANNVLLTGARGTGKSSLIKAVWFAVQSEHLPRPLRLIEIEKTHLADLPDLVERVADRPERFIVFCDDLSFEAGDYGYQALKTTLDGSIAAQSDNVLVYATSNRRHLVPEMMSDNQSTRIGNGEIHYAEAVEEKIALSDRFGLWLHFYAFNQEEYLAAARHWLSVLGQPAWNEHVATAALQWAQLRGARSGRVAAQFARDWAGRLGD
ncbi:ATP-binding protein [Chitinibacteraceae bacterium HSL-7]